MVTTYGVIESGQHSFISWIVAKRLQSNAWDQLYMSSLSFIIPRKDKNHVTQCLQMSHTTTAHLKTFCCCCSWWWWGVGVGGGGFIYSWLTWDAAKIKTCIFEPPISGTRISGTSYLSGRICPGTDVPTVFVRVYPEICASLSGQGFLVPDG